MDKNLLDLLQAYSDSQEQKIAQLEQTRENLESFMTANADKNDKIVEMVGKMQSQIDVIQKNTDYILRHISYMQEEILTLTKKMVIQKTENKLDKADEGDIMPLEIIPEAPMPEFTPEVVTPQPTEDPTVEPILPEPTPEPTVEPTPEPVVEPTPTVEENVAVETEAEPQEEKVEEKVEEKAEEPEPAPTEEKVEKKEVPSMSGSYENSFSQSAPYIDDIRKAISVGDRFLFQRELFKGNPELFQKTLERLNEMSSLNEALQYINSQFAWDKDSIAYQTFVNAIKRRFQEH